MVKDVTLDGFAPTTLSPRVAQLIFEVASNLCFSAYWFPGATACACELWLSDRQTDTDSKWWGDRQMKRADRYQCLGRMSVSMFVHAWEDCVRTCMRVCEPIWQCASTSCPQWHTDRPEVTPGRARIKSCRPSKSKLFTHFPKSNGKEGVARTSRSAVNKCIDNSKMFSIPSGLSARFCVWKLLLHSETNQGEPREEYSEISNYAADWCSHPVTP